MNSSKNIRSMLLLLLALFVGQTSFASDISKEGNFIVVKPGLTTTPVVNPGKGWVLYGKVKNQSAEELAIASLGYARYHWGKIEPEEGKYNWNIIDEDIKSWAEAGKQFSFGIMCASTHSADFWASPKWVFDAGAKYESFELKDPKLNTTGTPGLKIIPMFDHPVFMEKYRNFLRALAKRYNGNPNIAFIDIRSYGNWGEGHMHPFGKPEISADKYKEHIQMHIDVFRKTLLQLPTGKYAPYIPVYEWAVSKGVGLRRDGICGNSNGSEVSICAGKMAAVFELFGDYDFVVERGWWTGKKDKNGYGYTLAECVETGKPSYCDLSRGGKAGIRLMENEPALVTKLANRLGYHFVLTEAKYPATISSSKQETIEMSWENQGVAFLFVPATVSYALISPDKKVVKICDSKSFRPESWKPDGKITEKDQLYFGKVKAGDYTLAVALRQLDEKSNTFLKLGIDLKTTEGWYEIGPVKVKQ